MKIIRPKFRLLNSDELSSLEKQFIYFLSSMSITADEWVAIKANDEIKMLNTLTAFSDTVFMSTFHQLEFLIRSSTERVEVIHCQPTQMVKVVISINPDDAQSAIWSEEFIDEYVNQHNDCISIDAKKYPSDDRNRAIFYLMEHGFNITDGKLYKKLALLNMNNQNGSSG